MFSTLNNVYWMLSRSSENYRLSWQKTVEDEIDSLKRNSTWEFVDKLAEANGV